MLATAPKKKYRLSSKIRTSLLHQHPCPLTHRTEIHVKLHVHLLNMQWEESNKVLYQFHFMFCKKYSFTFPAGSLDLKSGFLNHIWTAFLTSLARQLLAQNPSFFFQNVKFFSKLGSRLDKYMSNNVYIFCF